MKCLRRLYDGMMTGSQCYAQWDITTSKRILADPRRMMILGLSLLPIFLIGVVFAEGVSNALPELLGGKQSYGPAYYTTTIFWPRSRSALSPGSSPAVSVRAAASLSPRP